MPMSPPLAFIENLNKGWSLFASEEGCHPDIPARIGYALKIRTPAEKVSPPLGKTFMPEVLPIPYVPPNPLLSESQSTLSKSPERTSSQEAQMLAMLPFITMTLEPFAGICNAPAEIADEVA